MTLARASLATLFALTLAACGGGGDDTSAAATPPATPPSPSPSPSPSPAPAAVAQAPLIVSAATPASANGTLDKTLTAGNNESGSSGATGNYASAGPNDYCRVAVYQMADSGDGKKYSLEVVFAKGTNVVSYVRLAQDVTPAGFTARAVAPVAGAVVDIASRRIGFTNTVLGAGGAYTATLNGSLEYSTNSVAADRATCG